MASLFDKRGVRQGASSKAGSRGKRRTGMVAGVAAFVASGALALSLVPSVAIGALGARVDATEYPTGTTAIADPVTLDGYKTFPTADAYDTTEYAGRLWTDKSVIVPEADGAIGNTAVIDLADSARDLDGSGTSASAGKLQVDKTDSGTFLTAVSVLSSSLEVSSKPVPLDIVLVLDVSGSMNYSFGGTQGYYPVYDSYTDKTQDNIAVWNNQSTNIYYQSGADSNGSPVYSRVYRRNNAWRTTNANNGAQLTPRTSGTDTNASHTQFYQLRTPTRMDALKDAVNGFIDTIAAVNDGLPADYQNRISIVKFAGAQSNTAGNTLENATYHYNNSQVFSNLAVYTSANKQDIENNVFLNLSSGGGTQAGSGMTLASNVLNGANRSDAQRVVVFFTDGEPGESGWDNTVANNAVSSARALKTNAANPTIIYSIGIFSGATSATPGNGTSNANRFMHAVSSNYPNASAYNNLGTRAAGSDFYLTAAGGGLTEVFGGIASQITSSGGQDAVSTGRDGNTGIIITDYLGDYMEFKGVDGILYGLTGDTTTFYAPGTQGAYHRQAQVQRDDRSATESVYTMNAEVPSALLSDVGDDGTVKSANLNLITIQVARSSDPKVGDTVTIKVPPELVPSLRYSVDETVNSLAGTSSTTVTRSTVDPLRIFYSVGPKAETLSGVLAQLEDQALRSSTATNESDRQSAAYQSFVADAAAYGSDGYYDLYSNHPTYDGYSVTQPVAGEATVDMTLSEANPYYFYVDEPLYVRSGSNYAKATGSNYTGTGDIYRRVQVWNVNGTSSDDYAAWSGEKELRDTDDFKGYYIPNGTAKTAVSDNTSVVVSKSSNDTNTATAALTSEFSGGTTATQHLGNNGVLRIPVYGTLGVTKSFSAGRGFSLPTDPVPTAEFTLTLRDEDGSELTEQGVYRALIRDSAGHPVDPTTHATVSNAELAKFYVKNGDEFTLRDGEMIKVTNLPDGATYSVVEAGQRGYRATVVDNDSTSTTFERNEPASTKPAGGGL